MNLFVNTLGKQAVLLLFNDDRIILKMKVFLIAGNESSLLIPNILNFLKESALKFSDISNIVVVNGPGSFTGIRTTILTINTIAYITKCKITPLSYFSLFNDYPIIKSSSRRDAFVQWNINSQIEIMQNDDIIKMLREKNINRVFGDIELEEINTIDTIDYFNVISNIELENNSRAEALYIKKPNIS